MENVFNISDPIVMDEYPENILVDENGEEIIIQESDEEIVEEIISSPELEALDSTPAVLADESGDSDSLVGDIVSGIGYLIDPQLGLIIDGVQEVGKYWDLFLDTFDVDYSSSVPFSDFNPLSGGLNATSFLYTQSDRTSYYFKTVNGFNYHLNVSNNNNFVFLGFLPYVPTTSVNGLDNYRILPSDNFNLDFVGDGSYLIVTKYFGSVPSNSGINLSLTFDGTYEDSYTLSEVGSSLVEINQTLQLIEHDIQVINTTALVFAVFFCAKSLCNKLFGRSL